MAKKVSELDPFPNPLDGSELTPIVQAGESYQATLQDIIDFVNAEITIANNAVTYAKMQDITATKRVIGRNTAGAGDPEEVSASQILDWLGTAAQGQILYRNGTTWVLLDPGTPGQYLKTMGAGANPAWATVATGGDASGPSSSVDNTLPRFDGATGKLLQTSGIVVSDTDELHGYLAKLNLQTGTTYTIDTASPGDRGKIIDHSNASAIAVTLPATAPAGFSCTYVQGGAGQITFASTGSGSMVNRQSHTKSAALNAVCLLYVRSNGSGTNAVWVLGGDTAA